MKAIIDADPLIYIIGFGHNDMPLHYQCKKMDSFIEEIITATEATEVALYLTGKGNFRDAVATILPYKGNRDPSHRPNKYRELREYLSQVWDAWVVRWMEADDACGIDAYKCKDEGKPYTVCTIDKDLKMLEGRHYNYTKKEFDDVDEIQALRFFYTQILTGDSSDNIPGLYKITKTKATKSIKQPIESMVSREEMEAYVYEVYGSHGVQPVVVDEISSLLWIARYPDEIQGVR